jgi:hypothetical protein
MSTSSLYHGFGARDYGYVRTKHVPGNVIVTIERRAETCRCAACGSDEVWRQGVVVRRTRTVPIGEKRVELEASVPTTTSRRGFISGTSIRGTRAKRAVLGTFS